MVAVVTVHAASEWKDGEDAMAVPPGATFEFETAVPCEDDTLPYLRERGANPRSVERAIRDYWAVEEVTRLDDGDGWGLYRIRWVDDAGWVVDCLSELDATVLKASGNADEWSVTVRFQNETSISTFHRRLTDNEVRFEIRRISRDASEERSAGLSVKQRETLQLALEKGYFDVPRKSSLNALAGETGVSDQAVSERLRRGIRGLIQDADHTR